MSCVDHRESNRFYYVGASKLDQFLVRQIQVKPFALEAPSGFAERKSPTLQKQTQG
jgi:hypothetical protein